MESTQHPRQRDMEDACTRCLQLAFDEFVDGLEKRDREKWGKFEVSPLGLEARLNNIVDKYPGKRPKFRRIVGHIINQLDRYSSGVDQIMQSQPVMVSGPWGAFRMVVTVAKEYQLTPELANKAVMHILDRLKSLESGDSCTDEKENALKSVYVQIFKLAHEATVIVEAHRIQRLLWSIFIERSGALQTIQGDLKEAIAEFRSVSGHAQRQESFRAIMGMVTRTSQRDDEDIKMRATKNINRATRDAKDGLKDKITPPFSVREATSGSCQWFFKEAAYERWAAKEGHHSILWVSAPLGFGKTVLAAHTATRLKGKDLVLLFHFRPSIEDSSECLDTFVWTLIDQAINSPKIVETPAFPEQVSRLNELLRNQRHVKVKHEALWGLLCSMLDTQAEYTILVDGLDECRFRRGTEDEMMRAVVNRLRALVETGKARVIVFCRPLPILQEFMAPDHSIRITPSMVAGDIRLSFEYWCNGRGIKEEDTCRILKQIEAKAGGSPLWARMYLDHLSDPPSQTQFEERMVSFPATLSEAYDKMVADNRKHLDESQVGQRNAILLAILTARRPMTFHELIDSHDLPRHRGPSTPVKLCLPFLEFRDGYMVFTHSSAAEHLLSPPSPSPTTSLRFSIEESNQCQARKCIEYLLQEKYGSLERIKALINRNYNLGEGDSAVAGGPDEDCFLEYAARYWFRHLVALQNPPRDLVETAENFLGTRQFAFWAEYVTDPANSKESVLVVEREIRKWLKQLPADLRDVIKLDEYFVWVYEEVSEAFSGIDGDELFQWLVLMALGEYFYERGDKRAVALRKKVAAGIIELRGKEDRLSLKVQAQEAEGYIWDGEMRTGRDRFVELCKIQKSVLGEGKPDMWQSMTQVARAQYYMNDYDDALATLNIAADGLYRTLGEKDTFYLSVLLYKLHILLKQGEAGDGASEMQKIYNKREAEFGPEDGFSIYIQGFLGEAYRKSGNMVCALQHLGDNYRYRQNQTSDSRDYFVVDAAISLSIAYRDFGMPDEARALIQKVEKDVTAALFERRCQLVHLSALLGVDRGQFRDSVQMLQAFVVQTDRGAYNRGFLWLLLDLATLLRRDERHHEANSLFDNLVVLKETDSRSAELDDEPTPPELLRLAEKALKLIRDETPAEAKALLRENNLVWVRERDTWYWEAASPTNTAIMKGPQ